MQKNILLIEDDETIALGIKIFLEKQGFKFNHKVSLIEAKNFIINTPNLDLILLDLNLPDGIGYDLCSWIRKQRDIPIIFLTVCDEESQMIKGLDMGADDYITKPFALSVLLSRMNAVLRRTQKQEKQNKIQCGNVILDEAKKCAYVDEKRVELSAGEYKLLSILFVHKNCTLTRSMLLEKLWDQEGNFVNDNTLTVMMKRLREKLNHPPFIKTVRGIGYLVEDMDE